ncbi:MAG: phospho-N-acetylmuramoyl-pentapeptide-transferase [Lachnospiraceae bacterium]|nr:phospho-N-acetylmuramoyl-pentapeptide-transferase [Lachnospiraceae bacterium]
MSTDTLIPLFLAFAISVALSPIVIPFLQKLKVGQTERKEGVQSHLKKTGTPTMGGLIILISILITSLIYVGRYPRIIPVLFLTLGFGIIGFLDDYLKVVLKRSDGLMPKQKMLGQIIVTTVFVVYLWRMDSSCLEFLIPFTHGYVLSGQWVKIAATPIAYIAIIGTVNGVNFTDGLDGLATGVTSIVAVFFTVVSIALKGGIEPMTAAVLGALLGFLLFNVHPAKVFMGDTGSLALGGFVAGSAYMMKMPIFLLIVGLIYVVEVVSVMIQVTYFKKTGGKRFFKMAPIHHHFELCGWSETRIDAVFTVITVFLCLIAMIGLQ